MRFIVGSSLLGLVLLLSPVSPAAGRASAPGLATGSTLAASPSLEVRTVARGLSQAWDVQELPDGALLVTERAGTLKLVDAGRVRPVAFPSQLVWAASETGLMGLAIDPDFSTNRRFYVCQGGLLGGGGHDVRVVAYTLDRNPNRARVARVLLNRLPSTSGQHGGCRLMVTTDGSLLVGTGDAVTGTVPRDLGSLGGKTLRLDRFTGAPWPTNPYAGRGGRREFVHTFGHRNVQGVAERADGTLWSIEQGTTTDDEVNLLTNGGDYGWNPVPGYNRQVPMTDQSLPGEQVDARWRSGPTPAASGGSFVRGEQWGTLDGALAVACLQGAQVMFLTFDGGGMLVDEVVPEELTRYGRMRTVSRAADGDLLITTGNGANQDVVLRVSPAPAAAQQS